MCVAINFYFFSFNIMNQSKLFAIAAAAAVMVSCGNEDGGGSTPLTPEENKEKLDRIGMDVIGMINPANHEDFCEAVDHFVEFSDEGNLGDVFHDPNAYSLMASTMQALKTACTKGDISGLLTKTEVTDYIYRAEDYYGVYNYRNGRWTYTEDDSKLEFRYSFNGDDIVATAVASGEESPAAEAAGENLPEETQVDPNKLAACEDPAINRLFDEYFTARLAADTDTLYRLFGRSGDASGQEELTSRLRAQASWIQSYDGISVYTMPGLADGDRVCIIRYKINFRRTNTNAPGIMYCYVQAQGDGSYRILENPDSETVKYINQKLEDPDVIAMQEEVNAELRSALSSDSDLALIYTSFLNGEIYNETAPDVNREQEVDLFLNPEDSDLVGGLVLEIDSETAAPEQGSEATQEGAESPEPGAEPPAEAPPEPETETEAPAETSPETGQEETIIQIG